MDALSWIRLQDLFEQALALPPAARAAFIDAACPPGDALRAELDALLAGHTEATGYFDRLSSTVLPSLAAARFALPAPADEPAGPDQHVAHYHLLEKLGGGGMGVVYKARDTKLGRLVALKFLPSPLSTNDEARQRFVQEAQAASGLDHPNIATIFEIGAAPAPGEREGRLYIAMAYYGGTTLKKVIAQGPLPVDDALNYAMQIARALAAAHRQGIVHRDVKPANVLVTGEGLVKVVDFGIAKVNGGALTKHGTALGTAAYMSPEQARGAAVDARTDVWSLGVVLHEMLTGERPFCGANEQAVIYSLLHEAPPLLSGLADRRATRLAQVIAKALAKHPDERHPDMDALLADLAALHASRPGERTARAARQQSIAVLPFENMSADPGQEYFCDGIAEEIINALAHLRNLRVVARTSAFAFKGQPADAIGRALQVNAVLEGSVRKAGNRLRITAQLIDVTDGCCLWAERYDRELEDVFAIQEEIALSIVDKLRVKLGSQEKAGLTHRGTASPEAYACFLKGRFYMNKHTPADLKRAVQYYRQAVERDPDYAQAYAGLALTYLTMNVSAETLSPRQAYPRARAAAARAYALDAGLSESQAVVGMVRMWFEWDWDGAEQAFRQALLLQPNDAFVYLQYSVYLAWTGRLDEALTALQHAASLDPVSPLVKVITGMCLYLSGRYPEAIAQLQETLGMELHFFLAHMCLGDMYCTLGRHEEAYVSFQKALALVGPQPMLLSGLGEVYASWGRREDALQTLAELKALSKQRYVSPVHMAGVYVALGDHEQGFSWLEKAYRARDPHLVILKVWPLPYDRVRADPRFEALIEQIGLTP